MFFITTKTATKKIPSKQHSVRNLNRYTRKEASPKHLHLHLVEDMKELVAGLRFEDKGAETGSRVTTTGVNQDREEAAERLGQRR